jgi:putative hydrolase of the HAD superfamily
MPIKAVLFDLDGTLYDRDALVRQVVRDQYDAFQHALSSISKDRFVERVIELEDHGIGDKPALYAKVAAEWDLPAGVADQLATSFWPLYERGCELSDDTRVTLQTLREWGMKLGVITNGSTEWQRRKLDSLGITSWFDAVLISEAEGVRKPDPEIFHRALARCGVDASEAIFVGDNPDADIRGALAAGLRAAWKSVPHWSCPHAVPTLGRLTDVLRLSGVDERR